MSDDKEAENETENWLSTIVEGGLPQILAGPAGNAVSRLIGASVEIPAAYVERVVQGIKDKTEARSTLSKVLAEQAAQHIANDPATIERAMNSMLARAYRAQVNKDEVAKVAIQDLAESPADKESDGPSDAWLDKFERYAEEASSEDLRITFGKILAKEVRVPGSVPNSAMHFLSILDPDTAKLVSRLLPCSVGAISGNNSVGIALTDMLEPKLNTVELTDLEHSGFCSSNKSFNPNLNEEGTYEVWINDNVLLTLKGRPNLKISLKSAILSKAGLGLLNAIYPDFDKESLKKLILKNQGISEISMLDFKTVKGKKIIVGHDITENPNFSPT